MSNITIDKQDGSQKNDEACFDTNANVSQYQGFTVLVDGATDDAPASGLCSDDAVLKQFENRLDVSNITLAGHSFGGATVLTFLARAHHMKLSSSQNDLQRKKKRYEAISMHRKYRYAMQNMQLSC